MDEHSEMFRRLPFPFDGGVFPVALGAVVQRTVVNGEQPAREVIHTEDGSWLVCDGINDPNEPGASVATHLWHAIDRNSSIAELATMPPGHVATRADPGHPWTVARHEWAPDE